jgi:pilus assembly protein CpaB
VLAASALVLGGIAASDVADREAALRRGVGPVTPVVFARAPIARGDSIPASSLALRRVPSRYAPQAAFAALAQVAGARAGADIEPGTDVVPALLASAEPAYGGAAAPGRRIVRVVAVGSAAEITPGTRVDVLATSERRRGGALTRLVLRGSRVAEAQPVESADEGGLPHVALALQVTLRQALRLAQAQAGAGALQALVRPEQGHAP